MSGFAGEVVISTIPDALGASADYQAGLDALGVRSNVLIRPSTHLHLDYGYEQYENDQAMYQTRLDERLARVGAQILLIMTAPMRRGDNQLTWQTDADLVDKSARMAQRRDVPVYVDSFPAIQDVGVTGASDFVVGNYRKSLADMATEVQGLDDFTEKALK